MSALNCKLSLYHELNTIILPAFGYVTREEGVALDGDGTSFSFEHDQLAYADPSGYIAPQNITIYDGGTPLASGEYTVNYVTSTVELNAAPAGEVTADYWRYPVKVIDAFPEDEDFELGDLPLVSLETTGLGQNNFAIGQSASFWKMSFVVDIFAPNDAMRLDMMDCIQRGLRKPLRLLDMAESQPLNYDGTLNQSFNPDDIHMRIVNIHGKTYGRILNNGSPSPKERFRASISGSYTDIS